MDKEGLEKRLKWYTKRYGPYIEKRGGRNWRNLFRKPLMYEWTILFMVLMAIFMGYAYESETAQCRETIANLGSICIQYCAVEFTNTQSNEGISFTHFEDITIKAGNQSLNDG